ncbi:MAG: tetraacyldisaccharide 4'-kinase [Planctomycetota bacterium]|nr:tetraacyldisaccharide 4'-kinase [Planctomycetota bacterium]
MVAPPAGRTGCSEAEAPGGADRMAMGLRGAFRSRLVGVMSGERRGTAAAAIRGALSIASVGFRLAYGLRRLAYSMGVVHAETVAAPVVSVGNITAGGTGKTPFVIWLATRLAGEGRRVAVLRRGYGAPGGGEDEETVLVRKAAPGTLVRVGADRVRCAAEAVREGADCLILDDGFQHWRLARDLDAVLVDATCPFGFGHMLPRGLLREPPEALSRAGAIVLTRVDLADEATLRAMKERIAKLAPSAPMAAARHRPVGLSPVWGSSAPQAGAPPGLSGSGVVAVSAIGNPSAFAGTLASAGARVLSEMRFDDHHSYREEDVEEIGRECERVGADFAVATEKDAVKLAALPPCHRPVLALRVSIEFLEGEEALLGAVRAALVRGDARRGDGHGVRMPAGDLSAKA